MHPAKIAKVATLLSIPGDLLADIGSWLDERNQCSLELASREIYSILSNPSRAGPGKRLLDLQRCFGGKPPSQDASRWFIRRIKRYYRIISKFHDTILKGVDGLDESRAGSALLPHMLAACAPSAQLILYIERAQGAHFLALPSATIPTGAGPELSSFWANVKQHLMVLSLEVPSGEGTAKDLRTLGMLTALRWLKVAGSFSHYNEHYFDMSEEVLELKLPHLVYLRLTLFKHGKLVLSCPKLKQAWFDQTKCLHIRIKDAILNHLLLDYCRKVDLAVSSPEIQLKNVTALRVWQCSEVGRHLIEDLGYMARLADMVYEDFPAACMPASFQQSLQHIQLRPLDWRHDLPEGLKELRKLTSFQFSGKRKSWEITRPLAELLPVHCLNSLRLGGRKYVRQGDGGDWYPEVKQR